MFTIQKQPAGTTWQTVGTEPTRREAMRELHRLAQAEPGPAWRAVDTKTGTALLYPAGYFSRVLITDSVPGNKLYIQYQTQKKGNIQPG